MLAGSSFASPDDRSAGELVFMTDLNDPVVVMLSRDGDATTFSGEHAPSLDSEPFRPQPVSYVWKNGGHGAGYSKRTPEVTASSLGGSLTSLAYAYGEGVTSKVPGILMPSGYQTELSLPAAITTGQYAIDGISYGGHYYVSFNGRYLLKIADEDGALSTVDLGVGYSGQSMVVFKNYLWISGGLIKRYDGTTVTTGSAAGVGTARSRLAVVYWTISPQIATGGAAGTGGTGAYRMIGTDVNNPKFYHVSEGDDPLVTGDWSTDINVGDGATYDIQTVVANNHTVWFATTGGLYACDETGYAPNLTEWVKQAYNPSNGAGSVFWNNYVWYAHVQGLMAIQVTGERQDLATYAQFGYLVPNQTPIYGFPRAFAPDVDGLWVGYYSESQNTSYLLQLLIDGEGRMRWSGPEAVFPGEILSLCRRVSPISAGAAPYLLIGTVGAVDGAPTGAPHLYQKSLPVSGNPYTDWLNGTQHRFAESSRIFLPREDCDSASKKTVDRYVVVAQNLSSNVTITVNASVDDGTFEEQGVATRSPRRTILADVDTPAGVNWQWRLDMVNTQTEPYVLESLGAGVAIIPQQQGIKTYKVTLASGDALKMGNSEIKDPGSRWKRIEAMQMRDRVHMRDQWGDDYLVRIEQSIPHQVYWDQHQAQWVMTGEIKVRFLVDTAKYNRGYSWSSGCIFGYGE